MENSIGLKRVSQIVRGYKNIRELTVNSPWVMDQTGITLYAINKTLQNTYKESVKTNAGTKYMTYNSKTKSLSQWPIQSWFRGLA